MDELLVLLFVTWMLVASATTVVSWTSMSLDTKIIQQCEEKGYWQMGQTRIKCEVENENSSDERPS